MTLSPAGRAPRTLVLFNYDWDRRAFERLASQWPMDHAGFDLFSFPDNAHLVWFDMQRFVDRLARQADRRGWQAVVSHHEQFGALTAALLAEQLGWPGTPVAAVLACQHKLYARQVLQQIQPDANPPSFARLPVAYGEPIPDGLNYPLFVKPIKAAFSVLAREVLSQADLQAMTRFGRRELWVIRRLVQPFEQIAQRRLPDAGTAHSLMIEAPVHAQQYNLDGYVCHGEIRPIGIVDSVMYPGTQAFMRFDYPSRLPQAVRDRALRLASKFLQAIGFTHGCFNMEFFQDAATDTLTVIEFNPRLAAQLSDLYLRATGFDAHQVSILLAHGIDPEAPSEQGSDHAGGPKESSVGNALRHITWLTSSPRAASSFVFRTFDPRQVPSPVSAGQLHAFANAFPKGWVLPMPKHGAGLARDFKWLGSHRYAVMHLDADSQPLLWHSCRQACALLGWPAPLEPDELTA